MFPGHVEMKSPLTLGLLYFNVSWKCSNIMGVIQENMCISFVGEGISAPDPLLYHTVSRIRWNGIRGVLKVIPFSSYNRQYIVTI